MKLGIQVNKFNWGSDEIIGPTFGALGCKAEDAGLYSFWVMDHFFEIPNVGAAEWPMLEGYSALAFIAGQTSKIKLGTLVTGVTYRYPGLLAKTATTLDVLSGGRAYLGIGAAWFDREHLGLGVPFPPLKERFERLEEALQIAHQMWSDNNGPFNGKHYQLAETLNSPQVLSKPHPPIMIGGGGETKTLRLVAQYADACNIFAMADDVVRHKLDVLRGHCDDLNRPYEETEKTSLTAFSVSKDGANNTRTPQWVIDHIGHLGELGFDHVIVSLGSRTVPETFDILREEVTPVIHGLATAGR